MSDNKPPFIVGQKLLRRMQSRGKWVYGAPFTVHIIEYQNWGWVVFDVHLNKFKASQCVCEAAYNSPLYQAMSEETE